MNWKVFGFMLCSFFTVMVINAAGKAAGETVTKVVVGGTFKEILGAEELERFIKQDTSTMLEDMKSPEKSDRIRQANREATTRAMPWYVTVIVVELILLLLVAFGTTLLVVRSVKRYDIHR